MMVCTGCFLFIQNTWKIPGNNLLLAELLLLMCLLYISFHPSSHYSESARHKYIPTRFLEFAFTLPILSVASAGAAGVTDILDLSWIFFSSMLMSLFILCIELHNHKKAVQGIQHTTIDIQASMVLLLNAWLCAIAFLVEFSVLLERAVAMNQRPWAIAAAILILVYHLLYIMAITTYQFCFDVDSHDQFVFFLDSLCILGKYSVTLTIMGGSIAVLEP